MGKYFGWAVSAIAATIAVVFTVNNHGSVLVDLWPLPFQAELPVFALVFVMLVLGFFLGAGAMWISSARWRRLARRSNREVASLSREVNTLRHRLERKEAEPAVARTPAHPPAD